MSSLFTVLSHVSKRKTSPETYSDQKNGLVTVIHEPGIPMSVWRTKEIVMLVNEIGQKKLKAY